ncbi:Ger(x)C family spore germination protein [Paenibacillus agricola]|uniref:Ger(X)C family spore germination protein n=1 Tax=Paenibacillus agricola TaxID=2716264 RepID=A0ABX0J620_9BACL|nr:Ger(x)C family spore germination protein [Paenibacillus agricola]NHN30841.1 Ger(x)C family spore germination protein [Paenibacillus agricola]
MHKLAATIMLSITIAVTTGCWNKLELTDWGFVQAAAIDETADGRIRLTSQVYKPGGSDKPSMEASQGSTFIDIINENETVYGASLDATNELGRNLQWSHMRVLLISEDIARHKNIGELLDFFSRTHEPRGTVAILITNGAASPYLTLKPLIESTMGQQLKSIEQLAHDQSSKTLEVTLTDVFKLSKEPFSTLTIPYVSRVKEAQEVATVSGIAVLNFPEGKISSIIPSERTPYLLMLMDQYKGGLITIPCSGPNKDAPSSYDSFRVNKLHTSLNPSLRNDKLFLQIRIVMEGTVGELSCSRTISEAEIKDFTTRIKQKVEKQIRDTFVYIQKQKADVIGIGIELHRWHNSLWKTWKPDWKEHFAESDFTIDVDVSLISTGVYAGKPFSANSNK